MRTFRSIQEAMNAVLPKQSDFAELGDLLIAHYRKVIETNSVSGKLLKKKTIQKKIYRGAKSPITKLLEGGGLAKQIKKIVSDKRLEVGFLNEEHIKFKPEDTSINVNDLARIHHFGSDNLPKRQFLVLSDDEHKIVSDWLRNVLRRNCG